MITFEQWMKKYSEYRYTDSTIKRYIRALLKVEEWLDIKLDKAILDIFDKEEFLKVQQFVKQAPDFDEVNRDHGHGDLSAGLSAYEKYLSYISDLKMNHQADGEPKNDIIDEKFTEISVKDAVSYIKSYINAKGFNYDDNLIENFYLSLKSKPFITLAGTSGTGKTRLVKLFAEAIGANYKMVPVRPDWSDPSDLFGHVNLNGQFISGAITEYVYDAANHQDKPYILCLDEMNLARVEYYMSDILSVIESRDFDNYARIVTEPLITREQCGNDPVALQKYADMQLPENLYIVGTVNMDETTFPFSRKVLDRANTIEFSYVNLMPQFTQSVEGDVKFMNLPNSFLKAEYLILQQCADERELVEEYCSELQDINHILQKANAHVGYRVRDEIVFYLLNNKKAGNLISEDEAMDNEIMQKILPRIQGSGASVRDMLISLFQYCMGNYSSLQPDQSDLSGIMLRMTKEAGCRYRKSAEKIAFMVRRYEEDGFTSYWL